MKINIKNIRLKSICATLFISLFLACNNGIEELEKRNTFLSSLANLGNDFLDSFTSFGDTLGGVLGFNTKTPKSEVGKYFKSVHDTVSSTKTALEKIVADMKDKGNPNAEAVSASVKTFIDDKLSKIIEGAEIASGAIGNDASEPIANVAKGGSNTDGAGVKGKDIENLVKGIKSIVDIVLKDKGSADAGTGKKADALASDRDANSSDVVKLFGSSGNQGAIAANADKAAADASKAVGAVTGADILQAMVKENGESAKLAEHKVDTAVTGMVSKNDATIAGAIALRAMAKGGKFANDNSTANIDVANTVKGAAVSAVTKVLNTLTIAIRKTIDAGLKEVKEAMKINPEATSVTSDKNIPESKK
ncbi:variable large family protein (plasmid) [Borrelia coriaceae]|uniref:variable large family protein n=1 Tax=Borrelia coriaceae TaxID=144 RepID=UPI001FF6332C|nr:variable large family protein [Borrelia coriaceae]UPA17118.1 variable large family protein [Borrelia coriaceae]UPA17229.1 variable large family protein [Borrelia coriaceae]